ncbi:MAG: tetratricopeptide repeat protein [Chthonomonadales bacterium]
MHRPKSAWAMVLVLCIAMGASASADPLTEGRALYKAGKYQEAVVKLEQAVKEQPGDAKAWWQLNFAYNKLGRYADALRAVEKAAQIDPQHTFASSPAKYEETLQRLRSKVGIAVTGARTEAGAVPTPSQRAAATGGSITQRLINGDVYVEPGIRVDPDRLEKVSLELRPTVVKFVVFNRDYRSASLAREGDRILNYLKSYINQGQGYVILASRRGIAVATKSLSRDTIRDLTGQVAPQIEAGRYTEGLEALAKGLVQAHTASAPSIQTGVGAPVPVPVTHRDPVGLIVAIIAAVVALIFFLAVLGRAIANKREMHARMGPLNTQKSEVIAGINMLEESAASLDPALAAQVRQYRIAAGTKLDEASRIIRSARSYVDLGRAQSLLDQAQGDIARGRALIDRSAGGAPPSVPDAVPPTQTQAPPPQDWSTVPADQRGVCFFCSRPMLLSELTPVTVNLSGQQQKVLACPDDLATIKTGQMPQIRAFNDNGRYVPWYAYQGYDPYRDYYRMGTGSFLGDLVALSLIDNMFWNWHHPMGWGWGGGWGGNTYVFYPDHEVYRDYYGGQAAGYGDFTRPPDDAAGTDFLQDTAGDAGGFAGSDRS